MGLSGLSTCGDLMFIKEFSLANHYYSCKGFLSKLSLVSMFYEDVYSHPIINNVICFCNNQIDSTDKGDSMRSYLPVSSVRQAIKKVHRHCSSGIQAFE